MESRLACHFVWLGSGSANMGCDGSRCCTCSGGSRFNRPGWKPLQVKPSTNKSINVEYLKPFNCMCSILIIIVQIQAVRVGLFISTFSPGWQRRQIQIIKAYANQTTLTLSPRTENLVVFKILIHLCQSTPKTYDLIRSKKLTCTLQQ